MKLRDQHYRINTQAFAVQQRVISVVITYLQSHPVTSLEVFFYDVGDTRALVRLRSLMPPASVPHLPAVEENATNERLRRNEVCLVMVVNDGGVPPILAQKHYAQPSAFTPENLLREARRQKRTTGSSIPEICVLDPDGDIVRSLLARGEARLEPGWACYHTQLYSFRPRRD